MKILPRSGLQPSTDRLRLPGYPILQDLLISVGGVGQLAAAAAIPCALLAPFMGVLSDRYGRRVMMASGIALLGMTTMLSATAWSFGSLVALRLLCGLGGAAAGPNLMAGPSDYFRPERRGRAGGVILAGFSLSTIVGVPLVACIAAYSG